MSTTAGTAVTMTATADDTVTMPATAGRDPQFPLCANDVAIDGTGIDGFSSESDSTSITSGSVDHIGSGGTSCTSDIDNQSYGSPKLPSFSDITESVNSDEGTFLSTHFANTNQYLNEKFVQATPS